MCTSKINLKVHPSQQQATDDAVIPQDRKDNKRKLMYVISDRVRISPHTFA